MGLDDLVTSRWDELQLWRLSLRVRGIEVTQAVQWFDASDHLTDPADRGPDNGVRLVAGKPAWVRVYPRRLFGASGLTGTLEVQRRVAGFFWTTVTELSPDPSSAASIPGIISQSYAAMRGSLNGSINFVIPADEMIGTLRLIARINSTDENAEGTVRVAVTLRQTLRLAGVMIAYNGPSGSAPGAPNLNLAAPVLADLQNMAGTALTLFPVRSVANFRTAGTLTQTVPLQSATFPTSGCGTAWDNLHAAVTQARTADGNRPGWIYYGLLPTGTPMGPVGGCGGGGVAVGPINAPGTLAHEAGHACGLGHAPAGGAPNPDPSYPAYEPYDPANTPQASIGEYGLNVNNGNIASPQIFRDFMGYGGPAWISLYHYGRLLDNARLNPTTVGIDEPWWKDLVWEELQRFPRIPVPDPPPFDLELPVYPPSRAQDVISLIVKVERGRVADVLHVARTIAHTELAAEATPFTARLIGAKGELLAEGTLQRLQIGAECSCGGRHAKEPDTYLAQAFLADVAPGSVLEIIADDDAVVWRREASSKPPQVEAPTVKIDRKGGATVSWDATGDISEYWLRWSRDGEAWQSVITGVTRRRAQLAAGQLPPGQGLLQVVAHDGFFSAASEPARVSVPDRREPPVILHPREGFTYTAGQTLRLWGSVADDGGDDDPGRAALWRLGRKDVGRGLDTFTSFEPGEHTLTLQTPGGSTSVSFYVGEPPSEE